MLLGSYLLPSPEKPCRSGLCTRFPVDVTEITLFADPPLPEKTASRVGRVRMYATVLLVTWLVTLACVGISLNRAGSLGIRGAGTRSRTRDLLITSQLLYQLSYTGKPGAIIAIARGE